MNVGRKYLVGWMELAKLFKVKIICCEYSHFIVSKNTSCPKVVSVFAVHDKYLPELDTTFPQSGSG